MLDTSFGDIHGGPAALPGAKTQVQVLYVGGFVDGIDAAEGAEQGGLIERTSAAAVQDPRQVLLRQRLVATQRKIFRTRSRHHGLSGFLATRSRRKTDLRGGAEEAGNAAESLIQRFEEARIDQHVVVQQADARIPGTRDAAVGGSRKREGSSRDFRPYLGVR